MNVSLGLRTRIGRYRGTKIDQGGGSRVKDSDVGDSARVQVIDGKDWQVRMCRRHICDNSRGVLLGIKRCEVVLPPSVRNGWRRMPGPSVNLRLTANIPQMRGCPQLFFDIARNGIIKCRKTINALKVRRIGGRENVPGGTRLRAKTSEELPSDDG
jgi:hypothetical protein